jgi:hypothetical protein
MKKIIALLLLSVAALRGGPPAPSSPWLLYSWANNGNYNPSSAFGSGGDLSTFSFPAAKRNVAFPAFLTTTVDSAVLGDLTGKTISATVSLTTTGTPVFIYGGNTPWSSWNTTCPVPANTRLYISTNPAAYDLQDASQNENDYWWSSGPNAAATINASTGTVVLTDTFDPTHWSNAQGHSAADPVYTAAFQAAVANVRQIGVSFGGGCFFDVGVAVKPNTGTAAFHLISYNVQ